MKIILIIEDDKEINQLVSSYLTESGYHTVSAYNGMEGRKLARTTSPDLILLDLMLPYHSGDEILKEIREFADTPIIMLSAKSMIQTKVDLLRLGADDYMTKPFDLKELLARIEVQLKRNPKSKMDIESNKIVSHDKITMDTSLKEVHVNNQLVCLTAKEYLILELFLKNPDKVFSKQNLYESIWNEPYAYDNDTINTHISSLRKKLKEGTQTDYIETVWSVGYKLKKL